MYVAIENSELLVAILSTYLQKELCAQLFIKSDALCSVPCRFLWNKLTIYISIETKNDIVCASKMSRISEVTLKSCNNYTMHSRLLLRTRDLVSSLHWASYQIQIYTVWFSKIWRASFKAWTSSSKLAISSSLDSCLSAHASDSYLRKTSCSLCPE